MSSGSEQKEIEMAKETFEKTHSMIEGLQTAPDTLEVIIVNPPKPKSKSTYDPAILLLNVCLKDLTPHPTNTCCVHYCCISHS